MKCYICREPSKLFICKDCQKIREGSEEIRRKPLTEWQAMKLGFYRHEKNWVNNIRNREFRTENGKQIVVLTNGKGTVIKKMPTVNS